MQRSRDNTARLAKALWTLEARDLSPREFQSRFDNIYSGAEGPATLWQLGGAVNDFLRVHPGTIKVPNELAPTLLSSTIVDGRIIGLKLLNRCSTDVTAISASICQALESRHKSELYGGLCELDNLLRRLETTVQVPTQDLLPRLRKLYSSSDIYIRETAERLANMLTG
jgi:hypothetical protein